MNKASVNKRKSKKQIYKYHSSDALRKSLERSKHIKLLQESKKTKISTLSLADALLEVFFEGIGWFGAHTSKEKNLIIGGNATHTDLRQSLQDGGYIRVEERHTGNGRKPVLILPGKKLSRYINKESLKEGRTFATVDQLESAKHNLKDEIDEKFLEHERRIAQLEKALKNAIEEIDPPFTEEKRAARLNLVHN